jgi:anti-anti-sigma regulatory factor
MKLGTKNAVLRIAIRRTEDVDTWILQGRLAGQAVAELTTAWQMRRGESGVRKTVVDLMDLTFVDELGERALMAMMVDGAKFVVRGLYTRTLVESLKEGCKLEA